MATKTPNIGLNVFPENSTSTVLNWRKNIASDEQTSDMMIIDKEIGDVKGKLDQSIINISKTNSALTDLSNTLSTINVNQSPTQTITDYSRILSLPKNAENGNVSVGVKGMTAQALGTNMDFSNGATGFALSANASVSGGQATLTGSGVNAFVQQQNVYPASSRTGNKLFVKCNIVANTLVGSGAFRCGGISGNDFCAQVTMPTLVGVSSTIITVQAGNANQLSLWISSGFTSGSLIIDNIFITDLTAILLDTLAATQCETVFPTWFDGMKSIKGRGRVKSISSDGIKKSHLYINTAETLRRVPNGTCDEIRKRADGGYELVQRCKEYTLLVSDVTGFGVTRTNIDTINVSTTNLDGIIPKQMGVSQQVLVIPNFAPSNLSTLIDDVAYARQYVYSTNVSSSIVLIVPKGTYPDQAAAQTALAGTKIIYQLATPVVTPIETSGTLLSYPSGTVYWENVTADAGMYSNGISILATGFPIAALETLSKVDFATGIETPLDVSTAVIAGNGLSFTHPSLVKGDIVFFTYSFANLAPEGNKTVQYYDSRYVIKDTTNGKYYQMTVTSTNGVASIGLVEV